MPSVADQVADDPFVLADRVFRDRRAEAVERLILLKVLEIRAAIESGPHLRRLPPSREDCVQGGRLATGRSARQARRDAYMPSNAGSLERA